MTNVMEPASLTVNSYMQLHEVVMMARKSNGSNQWPGTTGIVTELLKSINWDLTCFGPIEAWNYQLKNAITQLLHLPLPALLLHGPQNVALYNDRCLDLLGDRHPYLFGRPLAEGWSELAAYVELPISIARDGAPTIMEGQAIKILQNGCEHEVMADLHFIPVNNGQSDSMSVQLIIEELTSKQSIDREMRIDAAKMSAIFGQAGVGLSELSVKGEFIRVNTELCRMLARTEESLLHLSIADVTHPDDIAHSLHEVGRLIETGEPVSIDKRYVQPDGTVIWANSRVSLLSSALSRGPPALLAVTVDLTQRTLMTKALAASEARFRALAEASLVYIWQLNAGGGLVYHNPSFDRLFTEERILPHAWRELFHADTETMFLTSLERAQKQHRALQITVRINTKSGSTRSLEVYAEPWFTPQHEYSGHVLMSIDITDMVETKNKLLIANERLNLSIEGSGDGLWDWDVLHDQITVSQQMKHIAGYDDMPTQISADFWRSAIHPEDAEQVKNAMRAMLRGDKPTFRSEYRIRCRYGNWKWIQSRAIVVGRNMNGLPVRVAGLASDITSSRASREMMWQQANFDALTGLPNRRLFRSKLDHAVKMTYRTQMLLGLLFIDLDNFKQANDLLGHDAGDQLLIEAAQRILQCVRSSDTVARLGGDEFTAILMPIEATSDVELIAGKINVALAEPFKSGSDVVHLSGSIGITICPNDGIESEILIRNADQAMYVAKNSGRNQFSYFTTAMQDAARNRQNLIAELRMALQRNELEVYFQPIVALASGRVSMAEALLRWKHPRLGMLAPPDFMMVAEESGLISDIGDWVFQQAALYSRKWQKYFGTDFQISVNRSIVQFTARSKGNNWPAYLSQLQLAGSCMSVEITEPVLLDASPKVEFQLDEYSAAGIHVVIDDFGSGISSLSHLKKFHVDYLKVGQRFIQDIEKDGDNSIIRSVTAMAHQLGPQVIAMGIETDQQYALAMKAGCDYGQGFYFSPPISAEEFENIFHQGRCSISKNAEL